MRSSSALPVGPCTIQPPALTSSGVLPCVSAKLPWSKYCSPCAGALVYGPARNDIQLAALPQSERAATAFMPLAKYDSGSDVSDVVGAAGLVSRNSSHGSEELKPLVAVLTSLRYSWNTPTLGDFQYPISPRIISARPTCVVPGIPMPIAEPSAWFMSRSSKYARDGQVKWIM